MRANLSTAILVEIHNLQIRVLREICFILVELSTVFIGATNHQFDSDLLSNQAYRGFSQDLECYPTLSCETPHVAGQNMRIYTSQLFISYANTRVLIIDKNYALLNFGHSRKRSNKMVASLLLIYPHTKLFPDLTFGYTGVQHKL